MTVSINGNDFKRCKKETEMGRATENGLSEFLQHFLLPLWMCFFPRKSILSLNWKIPKVQKKKSSMISEGGGWMQILKKTSFKMLHQFVLSQ